MKCVSHADDMVLLSPSISAPRTIVATCEYYVVPVCSDIKSKRINLLCVKRALSNIPLVSCPVTCLNWVTKFKYLDH